MLSSKEEETTVVGLTSVVAPTDDDWNGVDEMTSLCMRCGENGTTRLMIHKIPYFRELIIASFQCEECGERNNEVTFGGEIQLQGCLYELKVTNSKDLDRQIIKSDSCTVKIKELDFEIPPLTQKGEISTIEGFLKTAAKNLSLYQSERMEQNPEVGEKVANVLLQLTLMASGGCYIKSSSSTSTYPCFHFILDDPAGNSFVENPFAPKSDPNLTKSFYFRTAAQDILLGLQPEKGVFKDDKNSNFKSLMFGRKFGEKNAESENSNIDLNLNKNIENNIDSNNDSNNEITNDNSSSNNNNGIKVNNINNNNNNNNNNNEIKLEDEIEKKEYDDEENIRLGFFFIALLVIFYFFFFIMFIVYLLIIFIYLFFFLFLLLLLLF
jgi:ZPR1 zinc finger protein